MRRMEFSKRLVKWLWIDCKTVRIFAYSSTRDLSNKRSLKTESETGERHRLNDSSHANQTLFLRSALAV